MLQTFPVIALILTMSASALGATPFDGTYKGGNINAGGSGTKCPAGTNFSIVVRDGVFNWRVNNDSTPIRVGTDGSFSGQSSGRFITGRIADSTMSAKTTGTACDYAWSLTR